MSNKHITAALQCREFKGTTRQLLVILADAASPGGEGVDKKKLPLGWCRRKLSTLMRQTRTRRQQTISGCLTEMREAGAIKIQYTKGSPLFFVDLDWLKANAFTEADEEEFEYLSLKRSRKSRDDAAQETKQEIAQEESEPNEDLLRAFAAVAAEDDIA